VRSQEVYVNNKDNIVMRSHFAKVLIDALYRNKTILNIDESNLWPSDTRNHSWIEKKASNRLHYHRTYSGRTLIAGIATNGLALG
jgi:hypothetical protein